MNASDKMAQEVQSTLNILLEAPYFYKSDDERLFLLLLRHKKAFAAFFGKFFGWTLIVDSKCARLAKPKWYNEQITLPNRDMFTFTKRDECIAFMLLLEFFERETREQGVGVDDAENLRFRFGDLLEYSAGRFRALFPDKKEDYADVRCQQIIRGIMPTLSKYRFLRKLKPSPGDSIGEEETIYECLPAMWHYQAAQLAQPIVGGDVE